ncbi:MAG: sulfatase, partial [Alkalispirochaeta sp.]
MGVPNILYIHSHDTGVAISPYGYQVSTPNLERFARRAVRFTHAFSVAPTCSPSRAGLLTGRYPHEVGMTGLAHRGFAWDDYQRHPAPRLSGLGYRSALCGVQHVAPRRRMLGYDEYIDDGLHGREYFDVPGLDPVNYDRGNARRAAEWIERRATGSRHDVPAPSAAPHAEPAGSSQARRPQAEPWFLSVGFLATHRPFPGSEAVHTPSEDRAAYHRAASELDQAVGTVLEAVDRADLWDSTVVFFTTDHGVPFPGHKGELRDAGTQVALMLWIPPGIAPPGQESAVVPGGVCDQLVSQIDLYPTMLELAGEAPTSEGSCPAPWEARSLLPILAGRRDTARDAVYAESNYHAAYEPARSVRTARYRLITRPGECLSRPPANVDDCPEKELPRVREQLRHDHAEVELYDL